MATTEKQSHTDTSTGTLKAFEDKIKAQVAEAKSMLDQFAAKAKDKMVAAETTTLNHLNAAKQEIDRKLHSLKTTADGHVADAKSEIETGVAKFKASVEEFGAKKKPADKPNV